MTPARGVTTIHGSCSLSLADLLRTSEAMSSPCIVVTPLAGVMVAGGTAMKKAQQENEIGKFAYIPAF